MARYIYAGVTTGGKQVKGEIDATSKNEVTSLLRKKKVQPVSINRKPIDLKFSFKVGVPLQDLSRFTRQFSAMTSAGLPLVQCLDVLATQTENKKLSETIQQISLDIQGGSTLSDALQKHQRIFNHLYCNMVAAGESSGNLDEVLKRLADYQEKADILRRKIKGAMTYPVIVGIVAGAVVSVLLTFVVPTFAKMFTDFGGTLPLPTRIVMGISNLLVHNFIVLVLVIAASVVAFWYYYNKTKQGRLVIDILTLKLPVIGELMRKSSVSRFSQTLSTLLSSGITIIDALTITAKTAGNKVLENGLLKTVERITGGMTIAEPLKETGVFPPMVIHMIAVGEKTGDLAEMLKKISEFYEEEVDAAVDALTSIIEPVMIVVLGVIVGGIVLAMYMPMFDMMNVVK
jgi:type IV pilus assembly protein PilC